MKSTVEATKVRIVYDAAARADGKPPFNDCLETGPSLQNKFWDVLIRKETTTSDGKWILQTSILTDLDQGTRKGLAVLPLN